MRHFEALLDWALELFGQREAPQPYELRVSFHDRDTQAKVASDIVLAMPKRMSTQNMRRYLSRCLASDIERTQAAQCAAHFSEKMNKP